MHYRNLHNDYRLHKNETKNFSKYRTKSGIEKNKVRTFARKSFVEKFDSIEIWIRKFRNILSIILALRERKALCFVFGKGSIKQESMDVEFVNKCRNTNE